MTSPQEGQADRVRELAVAFTTAVMEHLRAVEARRGESDAAVFAAYDRLRDAFTAYDESLYDAYDEVTPFVVVDEEEDEDDEDLDDDDDEDDDLDDDDDEDDEDDDELDDVEDLDEDDVRRENDYDGVDVDEADEDERRH